MYTLTTLCYTRLEIGKTRVKNINKSQDKFRHMKEEGGILIFDTGGGRNGTTTKRA